MAAVVGASLAVTTGTAAPYCIGASGRGGPPPHRYGYATGTPAKSVLVVGVWRRNIHRGVFPPFQELNATAPWLTINDLD